MENVLQNPSVQRVSAKLKELGINGEVHVLSDSARTAQEAADALGILVGQVASSIVFKLDDESPLLVITSGRHRVDTKLVAEKLASIYQLSIEEIALITTENSKQVFGI